MKTSILKFGSYGALLGGIIFIGSHYFATDIDFGTLEIFGYASIIASLSFIFFGIKHFRDKENNGLVSFGKALTIGLAISAIVGIVIGILDIIYIVYVNPDFATEYIQYTLDNVRDTMSQQDFEVYRAKLLKDMEAFDNPAFSGAFMFAIVFSIGIIASLISSLILQRKNRLKMKKRVTGIGGLFFKSTNPKESKDWYKKHLGFNTDDWGCTFWWKDKEANDCSTQWSPFPKDTDYYKPSDKDFMFNYRVENLEELLKVLKEEGVTIVGKMQTYDYGKFGWILDNDGNKIELWEPIDKAFQ